MTPVVSLEELVLLPTPRRLEPRAEKLMVDSSHFITCVGNPVLLLPIARILRDGVKKEHDLLWSIRAGRIGLVDSIVTLVLEPLSNVPAQGYVLVVDSAGITITASDAAGLFYGCMTLLQALRQSPQTLPGGTITDSPDFASRGVMLDISRDKVPKLETLLALVDMLSEWKINHLELYTEHTFAYERHPEVWAQASPMTGEDILQLDAYCWERFIELVPNQNSFGHMHRWLELPTYRHLAETTTGWETPWGERRLEPFSLNPTHPESLPFLDGLYSELLPHFSSHSFNVGCDETWDVGQGASREACERKGKGRIYFEFLMGIYELVQKYDRRMHFWGDVILQHPEFVSELPKDVTVLAWGYEANHPFDEHGERFAASGLPFFVCPGTSSWNAIVGRTQNAVENIRRAARNGLKHGAVGMLNTDWGDHGHWQHLPVSYLGFAVGAASSWCYETNADMDIPEVLNTHCFRDTAGEVGRVAFDLGNLYLEFPGPQFNSTVLFHLLHNRIPVEHLKEQLSVEALQKVGVRLDALSARLDRARMARPDADVVQAEFSNAIMMLRHACRRGLRAFEVTGDALSSVAMARELRSILGSYRELWMMRNRIGGLHDSTRVLEGRLREYTA